MTATFQGVISFPVVQILPFPSIAVSKVSNSASWTCIVAASSCNDPGLYRIPSDTGTTTEPSYICLRNDSAICLRSLQKKSWAPLQGSRNRLDIGKSTNTLPAPSPALSSALYSEDSRASCIDSGPPLQTAQKSDELSVIVESFCGQQPQALSLPVGLPEQGPTQSLCN